MKQGGALQVAHSFLYEINHDFNHEFAIVISDKLAGLVNVEEFSSNFKFFNYTIEPSLLKAFTGKDSFLNKVEKEFRPDRVFSVFGSTYWKPSVKHVCGFAKPAYIYKESPYFDQLIIKQKIELAFMEFVHMYDFKYFNSMLITENADVSNRLRKKVSQEVVTVSNTFNQVFKDEKQWDRTLMLHTENIDIKLLTIAANYPHKNLAIIKSVIPILRNLYPSFRFKFYLSVTMDDFGMDSKDSCNENVEFLGNVKINQCPWLYSQCDFLFLPTLLECFSASYCEAMYMKLPILTSDLSFARGICGDAAIYFNPINANDIAHAIYDLAKNKIKQNLLIEAGEAQLLSLETSQTRAKKYLDLITS